MISLQGRTHTFLAAGFIGFLAFGHVASAGQLSREQILEALTAKPAVVGLADRLRLTRSPTFDNREYAVATVQPKATIDLEVNFDFNSAMNHQRSGAATARTRCCTREPEPQGRHDIDRRPH
jgi:hypothetical protein